MTEHWLNYYGTLSLSGWTEEQLAQEVNKRTVETLRLVLKSGKIRANWPCGGGCHEKTNESYPLWGYSIAYRGENHDRPYGIQRSLVGLCRDCVEEALRVSLKEVPE